MIFEEVKEKMEGNQRKERKDAPESSLWLTRSELRRGFLMSEILGAPRALKPFSWVRYRRF